MAPISELHTTLPPMDINFDPYPAQQSFLSRVLTRFHVWRSRFKRKDRQRVARPQMTENRVSDTNEAVEIELDEYLATPTALSTPSFSVRSSIRSGVVDVDWAFDLGGDPGRVTDTQTSEFGSFTSSGALRLEGLPRLRMADADGVLPASSSPDLRAPCTQLEDTPSTNGHLTLSPSPIPLTPLDHELSLVDPFEALRAYANGDRSPLVDISGSTKRNPVLDAETIKPVVHPMTSPSIGEWDVAGRALATTCISFQKSPLSDSPLPSSDIGGGATSNFFPDHGRDFGCLRFASSRMNARSPPSSNEQSHDRAREFHIRLAAMNLEKGRRTIRVPTNVDISYFHFREFLKQRLTDKGDECIWRGLEMQDEPRL